LQGVVLCLPERRGSPAVQPVADRRRPGAGAVGKGEDLLFDETYLHYAENATSDDRIIRFCDVERPLRWQGLEQAGLYAVEYLLVLGMLAAFLATAFA
jgi:hypothetical protein